MYEKPGIFVVMTDDEDIITSSDGTLENVGVGGGTGGGSGNDDVIDWDDF